MPTPNVISRPAPSQFLFGAGPREPEVFQSNALALAKQFGGLPVSAGGPRMGIRADTASTLQAGVEPLLSMAVIGLGTPQHVRFPGSLIAPDVTKSKWIMTYWSWTGTPQLQIGEEGFKRAFRANRRRLEFTGSTTTTEMTRRSAETPLDILELQIADGSLAMQAHATALARDVVRLAEEREIQQLFGVAASYPALHSVDATGSEWDAAGGDSLADIDAAVDQLIAANPPLQREDVHAVITYGARDAAIGDPTLNALANSPSSFGRRPNLEDIRRYWDLGSVEVADVIFDDGSGGTPASMWGDTVVLFVRPGSGTSIVAEWGKQTFGVTFRFQSSGVAPPYLENQNTSMIFPFDSMCHPAMIQGSAGYLITNVKA